MNVRRDRTDLNPADCDALICIVPHRKPRLVWPSHLKKRFRTAHEHIPLYSQEFAPNGHRLDQLLYDLAWVLEGSPNAKEGSQGWLRFDLGARARQHCTVMGIGDYGIFEIPAPSPDIPKTRGRNATKEDAERIIQLLLRSQE